MLSIQGDIGEVITASELRKAGLTIIRNVYLPYNGHFTEIDMIGLSEVGLFVIENKNYSGVVSGNKTDKYWVVDYGIWGSSKLYNPILQNNLHKKEVIKLLRSFGYKDVPVFQPVIFNDKVNLVTENTEKYIFTLSDFIKAYTSVNVKNLDNFLIKDLVSLFTKYSNISDDMKIKHVELLKRV